MSVRIDTNALPAELYIDTSDPARGIRVALKPASARRPRFAEGPIDCGGGVPPDVPIRSLEYAVVDVETTGGAWSNGHRITEICAVRISGEGQWLDEYRTLVNPERPIPYGVACLTNIRWDMVRAAPRFGDIADDVARILSGAIFAAHNVPFDWRFLGAELDLAGRALTGRSLCTVRLARRVVPEVRSRSLDALSYFFNVINEARHRAYGDARATARILKRLLDRLDELEVQRWDQLQTLLERRSQKRRRLANPHAAREA